MNKDPEEENDEIESEEEDDASTGLAKEVVDE